MDREWITKPYFDGVKSDIEVKDSYYLSDKTVDKFQPELVGKSNRGKYIVRLSTGKNDDKGSFEQYEILKLTDTTLKIVHVRSGTVLEYTIVK
ncbi:MAG: hypothetical protein LBR26_11600 [Prevotella sp.]|jgi:type VI protein secretion system component Hcp|nr:hypothetical protein [Prevotella sp.]